MFKLSNHAKDNTIMVQYKYNGESKSKTLINASEVAKRKNYKPSELLKILKEIDLDGYGIRFRDECAARVCSTAWNNIVLEIDRKVTSRLA
jgi:hypothetical protein